MLIIYVHGLFSEASMNNQRVYLRDLPIFAWKKSHRTQKGQGSELDELLASASWCGIHMVFFSVQSLDQKKHGDVRMVSTRFNQHVIKWDLMT